ncbi:hypothetical protein KTR66_01165 [Roseococcus sp. SDR]|uniref:hypothetical protein n=1 Tax=Roseococcus sp. SDR TaxID=2835532 RepID=UPI001BCE7804|nr:hypothetical protein [Roseococcus sp. SDR]MBS7788581.1 hypothetical protein [Roseococcus sp. SDR]MBV1843895.1 hypothetical protein [Roseococcus sp. SDR]
MRLIQQRQAGSTRLWLGDAPQPLHLPPAGNLLALHLPRAAPASALVVETQSGLARLMAPAAGWVVLELPGPPLAVRAEGAPFQLSGALGEGPAFPACRLWQAEPGLIPENHWRRARILGQGAVLALAAGPARPCVTLRAGEVARIALPPLDLPGPVEPVLTALRGPLPLAGLEGLTLTLRAGAACEVLWEGVQLRPKSLANSAAPSLR